MAANRGNEQTSQDLTSTVAKHYNQLEEAGLDKRKDSRIFFLRNFNNWIKSVIIGETLQSIRNNVGHREDITVLDLCCGKGGDLLKWRKGNISKLVCADIAATSVEQCENRYHDMQNRVQYDRGPPQRLFSAEFITADCTKTRLKDLYKNPDMKFDLTSCQFSFHYCFESYPQAHMMLQNAAESLKLGGYFVGTTPDSYEIVNRIRESPDGSVGNDVYRITLCSEDKDNIPLFGAKYDFHLEGVVDCPEFLVYFPVLEKMAEEHGLKLVLRTPFDKYFAEKSEAGDHRSLLSKMQALESYPPNEGNELVGNKCEDYKEPEKLLQSMNEADDRPGDLKQRRPNRLGTLSKAEWDATTIYLVFMFQKVKDTKTGELWVPPASKESSSKRKHDAEEHTDTKRTSTMAS